MKLLENQKGYALLVVLLMVVLFLGVSATFMAGSLSNAKQEKTVDTSNQAVASAEMGARYFSTDFQRDLKMITNNVSGKTMERLLDLRNCFKSGTDTSCDEQSEITAKEALIDEEMLNLYVDGIMGKIDQLVLKQGDEFIPFSTDDIVYSIQSANGIKLNQHGEDIDAAGVIDTKIRLIEVRLIMEGVSDSVSKTLEAVFNIEVPPTFLNSSNPLTVHTEKISVDGVKYTDVFKPMPAISCTDLLAGLKNGTYTGMIECSLVSGENLEDFITKVKAAKLNPADFTVHTDDFLGNVCTGGKGNPCNKFDFAGVTVSVAANNVSATNNMNNLVGANLIINGLWSAGNNIQNLGDIDKSQTIVINELDVAINFPGMTNTNLLILGGEAVSPVSKVVFTEKKNEKKDFNVGINSRFCLDIDKIDTDSLDSIKEKTTFHTEETTKGLLIYYSRQSNPSFSLTGANVSERNKHVIFEPDYTTFLKACGLTIEHTVRNMTEVSIVENLNPGFELDVEY